jgi:signal transduction histidine kinase
LGPPLEHRELEEVRSSVAQLVAQLGEALASARGFAAEAAHELRTPLASLAGELELLAERASANDVPAVEGARRKVADLVSLVQRLLILAQPDAISLATSDTVDLGDVLEAACATLPEPQRERLRSEVQDDVLVRGDTALLVAMLTNAIDNALKFSSAPVTVVVRRDGARVRVSVTDQGPGIPLEERERVFEPFYRSRAARQSNTLGHGVGLALMMHVARAHGGHVSLLSETDVGTTLEVELPAWTPRALSVEP